MFHLVSDIRKSLPTQITLWVVGFTIIIIGICLFLISGFSDAISIDTGNDKLLTVAVIMAALSLIVIVVLCWVVVTHHLRPLRLLAETMQRIANGQMKGAVKDSGTQDEIGQLQTSFASMQRAMANYLSEMEQKRITLSRQNDELQAAYEQVRESDNIKTQFLNRMTGRMSQNIEAIVSMTDTICNHYHELSKAELMKMQVEMISYTDTVTLLLNKMLENSKEKDKV